MEERGPQIWYLFIWLLGPSGCCASDDTLSHHLVGLMTALRYAPQTSDINLCWPSNNNRRFKEFYFFKNYNSNELQCSVKFGSDVTNGGDGGVSDQESEGFGRGHFLNNQIKSTRWECVDAAQSRISPRLSPKRSHCGFFRHGQCSEGAFWATMAARKNVSEVPRHSKKMKKKNF